MTSKREQFRDTLSEITSSLEQRSIRYVAIGSVALNALGVKTIDFSPRPAVKEIDT